MHRLSSRTNQAKTVLRSFKLSKNAQIGSIRQMSDNLLGHSPMAGTTPANKNLRGDQGKKPDGPKIGVDSNTEGGECGLKLARNEINSGNSNSN